MNKIVIFGIADGVQNEVKSLPKFDYDFMAVGMDALEVLPVNLKYVVTNHKEDLLYIQRYKQRKVKRGGFKIVSHIIHPSIDITLTPPYEGPPGSSSITGVMIALMLGYEKIILCWCPLS